MPEPESAPPALPPAGRYRLDPQHTFAQLGVKHLLVGRVDGRFDALTGNSSSWTTPTTSSTRSSSA
jgi:polyisoprenoid-binding protein YceI